MNKIKLIAVLIPLLFHLNVNAGTLCQTMTPATDSEKYSMELIPEEIGNVVLVKFTIPEDCYVSIKVTDIPGNTVQELVQDEMTAGTYIVYHKCAGNIFNESDRYIMDIYESHDDKGMKIHSKELNLSAKKN
ncbi:MAG: hypothetical protein IPM96_09960 [Ignavibacteria bacterium]|nr:hypothetical protein [Ignavibacteria bacterium]